MPALRISRQSLACRQGTDVLVGVSAVAWAYLLLARGGFWRATPTLGAVGDPAPGAAAERHDSASGGHDSESRRPDSESRRPDSESRRSDRAPGGHGAAVVAIVPARNEADLLPRTLHLLARQASAGLVGVVVVDDASTDDTAGVAEATGTGSVPVVVTRSAPLPRGWSGKVWALEQGRRVALARWRVGPDEANLGPAEEGFGPAEHGTGPAEHGTKPAWLWLVDADIAVGDGVLARLLAEAEAGDRDLVSVMARLRVQHPAERLLVPAFVYFFQLLYPFRWVGRPGARTAAAAGGCVLVRTAALERIGGFSSIAGRRIDDIALARAIRRGGRDGGPRPGRLWLGFDDGVESLRPYDALRPLWQMVARNAFTQLGESWTLLAVTVAGLGLTFVAPFLLAGARWLAVLRSGRLDGCAFATGATATFAASVLSYLPTVRRCGLPRRWALTLPVASVLYAGMTVDSARRSRAGISWRGRPLEGARPRA